MATRTIIGRTLLAADIAERRIDADDLAEHRRQHREAAEAAIRHHGLLEIDFPDFLARMRCAQVEAGMLHMEEPGDDWFRVQATLEELVSALDHAISADAARRVEGAA